MNPISGHICLFTLGFDKKYTQLLCNKLNKTLDIQAEPSHQKNKYFVYIPWRHTKKFLKYIGKCPIECYKHKWELLPHKNKGRGCKRRIIQKDLNNNIIKIWKSQSEAAKSLGIFSARISDCCNGITKTCQNFKWEFYDNK